MREWGLACKDFESELSRSSENNTTSRTSDWLTDLKPAEKNADAGSSETQEMVADT